MVMLKVLDLIFYGSAVAALVALPFLLIHVARYSWARHRADHPDRVPAVNLKLIVWFIGSILVSFGAATIATSATRQDVLNFLRRSPPADLAVTVNDELVPNTHEVISVLGAISPYRAHHSHPTRRICVKVRSVADSLVLHLGRDSGDPREYWVFVPAHGITSNNEIGRVTTSLFDEY